MLYDALVKIVADICFHVGIPISVQYIARILDNVFDDDLIEVVCLRMLREGKLVKWGDDAYTMRNMQRSCLVNLLITEEYQRLGLALMQTDGNAVVRHIPVDAEHRFLTIAPSSLGAKAGIGLFVRTNRAIPQGCIFCEYRGCILKAMPKTVAQGTYVVRVRNSAVFINGVNERNENMSLATFINDGGPGLMNAGMMEYDRYPGRVFLMASRDLRPGEEVFVLYGATYWGAASYDALRVKLSSHGATSQATSMTRKKRHVMAIGAPRKRRRPAAAVSELSSSSSSSSAVAAAENAFGAQPTPSLSSSSSSISSCSLTLSIDKGSPVAHRAVAPFSPLLTTGEDADVCHPLFNFVRACRRCGETVLGRSVKMHSAYCGDSLVHTRLMNMDCVPWNEFTALENHQKILVTGRTKMMNRATSLVDLSQPQTFSHTHEDAVNDLEFTFVDADATGETR